MQRMGGCGSKTRDHDKIWMEYFSENVKESLRAQEEMFQTMVRTSSTDVMTPAMTAKFCKEQQVKFSKKHQSLAKSIFKQYDQDKDGFLCATELQMLTRDCLNSARSHGAKYMTEFLETSLQQTERSMKLMAKETANTIRPAALERFQFEFRTMRHEAVLAMEARSQEMLRNVRGIASALLERMRPAQHDTKVSLAEFKESFFVSAAEVLDPLGSIRQTNTNANPAAAQNAPQLQQQQQQGLLRRSALGASLVGVGGGAGGGAGDSSGIGVAGAGAVDASGRLTGATVDLANGGPGAAGAFDGGDFPHGMIGTAGMTDIERRFAAFSSGVDAYNGRGGGGGGGGGGDAGGGGGGGGGRGAGKQPRDSNYYYSTGFDSEEDDSNSQSSSRSESRSTRSVSRRACHSKKSHRTNFIP